MIQQVELTADEQELYNSICWNLAVLSNQSYEHRKAVFTAMGKLARLLLDRRAIPKVRIDYFTDPEFNIGGHGKSRKQIFEKNGKRGQAFLEHPDFMKHLRYFIHGPDLPPDTVREFCRIIDEDHGTSGMVLDQLKAFVRKEVREKRMEPSEAAEEFFKLAHEVGQTFEAETIRSAAKSVKLR